MGLFRFAFPFGRPEGALKATLSLLERVLTKDISAPISRDEIRFFIRKCLENAAYTNYTRVSDQAKIEGNPFESFLIYITCKKPCFSAQNFLFIISLFPGERENQQQNDNGKYSMSPSFVVVILNACCLTPCFTFFSK